MAGRTNPKGGGGDQFHHIFTQRQGEFGVHNTVTGKIVYQRPRHYWNSSDLMRIMPKVAEEVERNPPENEENWTWWEKAINFLADWMISKIIANVNLSEGFAPVVWSAVMTTWQKFLQRLFPDDYRVLEVTRLYERRLRTALETYLNAPPEKKFDAKKTSELLTEKLLQDMMGIKE